MNDTRKIKTFFKYHTPEEVDELMGISGFKLENVYPDSINDTRLYKKGRFGLFSNVLNPEIIKSQIPNGDTIEDSETPILRVVDENEGFQRILPNPKSLSIENLYIKVLNSISNEIKDSKKFHVLISYMIGRIFRASLKNMKIEQEQHKGRKFIDTVYTNSAKDGFFKEINENSKINCKYIIVEAKNLTFDPENPEFDQLASRLNKIVGNFGILVCKKINNNDLALERCQSYLDDEKYVIFLSGDEIIRLLEFSGANLYDQINNFLDTKLRSIIFRTRK